MKKFDTGNRRNSIQVNYHEEMDPALNENFQEESILLKNSKAHSYVSNKRYSTSTKGRDKISTGPITANPKTDGVDQWNNQSFEMINSIY